jgi:hypothetical protein
MGVCMREVNESGLAVRRRALLLLFATGVLFVALVVAPAVADGALAWSGSFGIDHFGSPGTAGISCPATSQCTLVDRSGQEVTFNPATPGTTTPVDIDGDNSLSGVVCPTTSQCTAVDEYGTEFTFNPAAASVSATITSAAVQAGNGPSIELACFSTTECTTVSASDSDTAIEVTFNPTTATITKAAATIDGSDGGDVYGLSCPTASQCTEVDYGGDEVTFNPITATVARDSSVSSYTPYGVACPTSGQCTTVNSDGQEVTFAPASGTISRTASIDSTNLLVAVACSNTGQCTATDPGGNEIRFDPSSGSVGSTTLISVTGAGDLSCPSAGQCTALDGGVGGLHGEEYTLTGIGTGEIVEETGVVDGGEPLNAVACSSANQCSAVDEEGYEVTFDPLSGSVLNSILIGSVDYLTDVACDGTAQCTAVDQNGVETTFTPSTGAIIRSVKVNGGSQINGVACPANNQCTGVDEDGYETTFNPTSGVVVSSTKLFTGASNYGESVDCPSLTQCTAVSHEGDTATFNPQSGAAVLASTQLDGGRFLNRVACPSGAECVAVGDSGREVTFNPITPGAPTADDIDADSVLLGLACPSISQCTATDDLGHSLTFNPSAPGTPPIVTAENHELYALACTSNVFCVAVDDVGDALVATGPPAELSAPTISGNPAYGQLLSESHGSWFNTTTGYSYQWERCNAAGADCVAIPGATAPTYKLALADIGSTIAISETASNAQGTGTAATSSPTAVIQGLGRASVGKIKSRKPSKNKKASKSKQANVTATVSCTGTPIQICTGVLTITVVEHFRGHKLIATSANAHRKSKAPKRTKKTVTIARASYSLTVGAKTQLALTLNRTGKRLLSQHGGKLKVRLGVIPTGDTKQVRAKTITLMG